MMRYDAMIIKQYAQILYRRANTTTVVHTILGALVGVVPFAIGGQLADLGVVTLFIFAGLGYMIGSNKGFSMRLEAQIALCQVQIEENTRRSKSRPSHQKVSYDKGENVSET